MSTLDHLTTTELVQQGEALRALGRCLLGRDDADDLVQESWLAALRARGPRHLGGWLVGTLRHLAASRRRAEARRRSREQVVAAPGAIPPVADTVAHAEVVRRVAAEVASLHEPYRSAIVLRFWHGLSPQQLATRLLVSVDTARSRVKRGVALLRTRLSQSCGNAWAAPLAAVIDGAVKSGIPIANPAVVSRCSETVAPAGGALTFGGLLVVHYKLLVVGGALALGLLGLQFLAGGQPAPPRPDVSMTVGADPAAAGAGTARDEQAQREMVSPVPARASAADPQLATAVVVRVSASGAAVPGVGIALRPVAEVDLSQSVVVPTFVPTDRNGEVRFDALTAGTWSIDIDRVGSVGTVEARLGETSVRDVRLPAGSTVDGSVLDEAGNPVAGARIVAHRNHLITPVLTVTDAAGRFRLQHLAPGGALQARLPGRVPSLAHSVDASPESRVELVLRIGGAARRLDGRVLGGDGRPLAEAAVAVLPEAGRSKALDLSKPQLRATWLRSDAEGRFCCDEIDAGRQVVFARPRNIATAPCWAEAEADATLADAYVELRCAPGAAIHGTLRRGGEPLGGIMIWTWSESNAARIGYLLNLFGRRTTTTAADGSFRLEGLLPGKLSLRVLDGMALLHEGMRTLDPGTDTSWDVVVAEVAPLRIAVRPAEAAGPHRIVAVVYRNSGLGVGAPSVIPFGADGICEFTGDRAPTADILIESRPSGRDVIQFARRRSVPVTEREVEFDLAGKLPVRQVRGRLVDGRRAAIAGVTLVARRCDASDLIVSRETVTAADGTFAFGPLPAGTYLVTHGKPPGSPPLARAVVTADRDEDLGEVVDRGR